MGYDDFVKAGAIVARVNRRGFAAHLKKGPRENGIMLSQTSPPRGRDCYQTARPFKSGPAEWGSGMMEWWNVGRMHN